MQFLSITNNQFNLKLKFHKTSLIFPYRWTCAILILYSSVAVTKRKKQNKTCTWLGLSIRTHFTFMEINVILHTYGRIYHQLYSSCSGFFPTHKFHVASLLLLVLALHLRRQCGRLRHCLKTGSQQLDLVRGATQTYKFITDMLRNFTQSFLFLCVLSPPERLQDQTVCDNLQLNVGNKTGACCLQKTRPGPE